MNLLIVEQFLTKFHSCKGTGAHGLFHGTSTVTTIVINMAFRQIRKWLTLKLIHYLWLVNQKRQPKVTNALGCRHAAMPAEIMQFYIIWLLKTTWPDLQKLATSCDNFEQWTKKAHLTDFQSIFKLLAYHWTTVLYLSSGIRAATSTQSGNSKHSVYFPLL